MTPRAAGRGFWPLRDLPVVFWLLAAITVVVLHSVVPVPRWLMIHLLLLGAVSNAIVVWSRYFTDALLHTEVDDRPTQSRRLLLLNAGVVAVVCGVVAGLWPVTVAGATAVAGTALWHGWSLARLLQGALPSRFSGTVRYYLAAACFLPVGAALGAALARGLGEPWQTRLVVAHVAVNLLGWMGLTVVGTLVTLWPTMLRTRIADGAERAAARALPVLSGSVLVTAGAAAADLRRVAVLGLVGYAAGLALTARSFLEPMRRKPPRSFATHSVLAGLGWLIGCLAVLALGLARAGSWADAGETFDRVAPFLAAGFGAQVLLGALSYLVPVALGGGPTPVRAANAVLDRATPVRVAVANAALLACALPVPGEARTVAAALALGALGCWLPLLVLALRRSRRARSDTARRGEPLSGAGTPG